MLVILEVLVVTEREETTVSAKFQLLRHCAAGAGNQKPIFIRYESIHSFCRGQSRESLQLGEGLNFLLVSIIKIRFSNVITDASKSGS